jgi:DNA end-binding protein Ku
VKRAEIDPRYFERPYYLVPAKKAEKGYVLLREILKRSEKVGIARVVIRTRQYLSALMPHGDALVLVLMRFPQEIVEPDEFQVPHGVTGKFRVSPQELAMGEQLIDSMTTAWKPADYKDEFRGRLRKIIDAQIARQEGKRVKAPAVVEARKPATGNVIDFTALLKKSLAGRNGSPKRARPAGGRRKTASRGKAG